MSAETLKLDDWVSRPDRAVDVVTATKAAGMAVTLDRDDTPPSDGDPLPPLWHWMFHAPMVRRAGLGRDGHPALGSFMPPVALPRRMFAGGRLRFLQPIRVGDTIERVGEVVSITPKQGRSGALVFVTVRYVISNEAGPAIEEEQDIVYREEQTASPADDEADTETMPWRRQVEPDPTMLFRYSALTFNGHRIHYDWPYATGVEGYPGLIVHGPMIATYLAELCLDNSEGRSFVAFEFRAFRPLFDTAPFTVAGGPARPDGRCPMIAVGPRGETAMTAIVTLSSD